MTPESAVRTGGCRMTDTITFSLPRPVVEHLRSVLMGPFCNADASHPLVAMLDAALAAPQPQCCPYCFGTGKLNSQPPFGWQWKCECREQPEPQPVKQSLYIKGTLQSDGTYDIQDRKP